VRSRQIGIDRISRNIEGEADFSAKRLIESGHTVTVCGTASADKHQGGKDSGRRRLLRRPSSQNTAEGRLIAY